MIEVEVKLKVNSLEEIAQLLTEKGCRRESFVRETDWYFTGEQRDFWQRDEALRVRKIVDLESGLATAVLTFKGPKLDAVSMTRRELETKVEDAVVAKQILESIGFRAVVPVEKERQVYTYLEKNGVSICLDHVKDLGDFMEVEILVESEAERESALCEIAAILDELGYAMRDTTRRSYLSQLLEKGR